MTTISLTIRRDLNTLQPFSVAFREGMSLLDALKAISADDATDLAYRWECGGQRICGVCTVKVNGTPMLSCAVALQPGTDYLVEPLDGFAVAKDLVIDLSVRLERLNKVQPYLIDGGRPIQSRAEAEASKLLRSCIECWACVSVCPVSLNLAPESAAADALGMVKLARFALDPRDGANRAEMATNAGLDIYAGTCPGCRRCADVCPKSIDVYLHAVQVLEAANDNA